MALSKLLIRLKLFKFNKKDSQQRDRDLLGLFSVNFEQACDLEVSHTNMVFTRRQKLLKLATD